MACLFSCKVDTLNKMYALITTEMNMFIKTVKPRIKEVRMHQDSQGKIDIIINHFCLTMAAYRVHQRTELTENQIYL